MASEREHRLERELKKLEKINSSLMNRVERSMARQGSAYSLFHTAIGLESQVRLRTEELRTALINLERTNDELVSARDSSERANRVKTRFFTAAGHDLLQPLHAARLSLSALEESENQSEQRRLTTQIDHALQSIEELLKTILDLSKLEAGVIQPKLETIALTELFESLIVDIEPIAQAKNLRVRWKATDCGARSDVMMLRRILQNLLANAVRYTDSGAIGLYARRRGDDVRIEIWDTGPGIAQTERERIFEEFQRGSNAGRGGTGFGLGLAIVQRMAQALDHPLGLCSSVGRGTCFHVTAPCATVQPSQKLGIYEQPRQARVSYGFPKANVVILDNDDDVLNAMKVLLDRWSCNTQAAYDVAGVKKILDGGTFRPDIVLADFHLDHGACGIEGVQLARQYWGPDLPAVIITADHGSETKKMVAEANCEILHKPVRPAELRALMLHLLG